MGSIFKNWVAMPGSVDEQADKVKDQVSSALALIICVEIMSNSNTISEMQYKRTLYFAQGAQEFWLCQQDGAISFYSPTGQITASQLAPAFPNRVDI